MIVIARERSDEAIQTLAHAARVWIASQGECAAFVRPAARNDDGDFI
jgi:hypothetical protein